jgi:hypothetical protein
VEEQSFTKSALELSRCKPGSRCVRQRVGGGEERRGGLSVRAGGDIDGKDGEQRRSEGGGILKQELGGHRCMVADEAGRNAAVSPGKLAEDLLECREMTRWRRLSLGLLGASLLSGVPGARGQSGSAAVTNTAPPPSTRFPASWYPPAAENTYTAAPLVGKPYTAVLETSTSAINPATGERKTFLQRTLQARDAQGRRRDEVEQPRPDGKGGTVMAHEVSVTDPVAHCSFQWMEPWVAPGKPIATVSCMARTVHYTSQNVFRDAVVTERKEQRSRFDHTVREPLGRRSMNGLDVVGTRSTVERLGAQGELAGSIVTEIWYAPELDELMSMRQEPGADAGAPSVGLPSFTLTDVHRGSPDPKLFYPPAEYQIQSAYPYTR